MNILKNIGKETKVVETVDNSLKNKEKLQSEERLKKLVENNKDFSYDKSHEKPISDNQLDEIRKDVINSHTDIVLNAMYDDGDRQKLVEIIRKEHKALLKNNKANLDETIEYVVREIAGTGIIEELLKDDTVEDITWDGTNLVVEKSSGLEWVDTSNFPISEEYINKIVSRFAINVNSDFSSAKPILDARLDNMRLNAVHSDNTTTGTTISLRVLRKRLALNRENFNIFAPNYMLDFFERMMKAHVNMTISGETGTGKTEFQKLLLSMVEPRDKMIMIEDVPELQIKEMFPEKLALNWITSSKQGITNFVKASLRNNPKYIIVSETRGEEALEMLQAVLSGHFVITSLHTISADATPKRFSNMCARGFSNVNSESIEEDFRRYFNFGCHIKRVVDNKTGERIRYLAEVMEFNEDENKTIFKQRYIGGGRYKVEFENDLSTPLKQRMEEENVYWEIPDSKYWEDRNADGNDILKEKIQERLSRYEKVKSRYGNNSLVTNILSEIEFYSELEAYQSMVEEEEKLLAVISDIDGEEYEDLLDVVKGVEEKKVDLGKEIVADVSNRTKEQEDANTDKKKSKNH